MAHLLLCTASLGCAGPAEVDARGTSLGPDDRAIAADIQGSTSDDAGTGDTSVRTAFPAPPEIHVAPPAMALSDCAPIFVNANGVCEPRVALCGDFEAAVPTLGCVSLETRHVARRVPAGEIAVVSPQGRLTQSNFGLREALASAPPGATLYLGPGDYVGGVTVDKAVRIVGSGVRYTTIVAEPGARATDAIVVVEGGALGLTDLSFQTVGDNVRALAGITEIERVIFGSPQGWGIGLAGTARVRVRRARNRAGEAIVLYAGTPSLVVEESALAGPRRPLLVSNAVGSTVLENVAFDDAGPVESTSALVVAPVGSLTMDSVCILSGQGSLSTSQALPIVGTDVVIMGPATVFGDLWLERGYLDVHSTPGAASLGTVRVINGDLTDVSILGATGDVLFGYGLRIAGTVAGRRIRIDGASGAGLVIDGSASFHAEDVEIVGTIAQTPNSLPVGAAVNALGQLKLVRARIVSDGYGVKATGFCDVDLSEVHISGRAPGATGESNRGSGLLVNAGGLAKLRDVVISDTTATGVWSYRGRIDANRLWISDVHAGVIQDRDLGEISGISDGVLAVFPTELHLTNTYVEGCERAGFVVQDPVGVVDHSGVHDARFGVATLGAVAEFIGAGNVLECGVPIWTNAEILVPTRPNL